MSVASKALVLVTACHGVSELRTVWVFCREFSWDCAVIARAHALLPVFLLVAPLQFTGSTVVVQRGTVRVG